METYITGQNPSAFWKLNETSGTIADDSTANNYDLAINGDTTLGVAATDGTTGYRIGASAPGYLTGTGPTISGTTWSMGIWFRGIDLPPLIGTGATTSITASNINTHWIPLIATGTWLDSTNKTDWGVGVFAARTSSGTVDGTDTRIGIAGWDISTNTLKTRATLTNTFFSNQWHYIGIGSNAATNTYGIYIVSNTGESFITSSGTINANPQSTYLIGAAHPSGTNASSRYVNGIIDNPLVFNNVAWAQSNLTSMTNAWTPTRLPAISTRPAISGTRTVGQTLTTTDGTWTNSPTNYYYQWQRSANNSTWTNISGATNSTYTIVNDDVNNYLRCQVRAENPRGIVASEPLAANTVFLGAPQINKRALVTGKKYNGQTLTGDTATFNNGLEPITTIIKWQRSTDSITWEDIAGATSSSYTLQSADIGKYVRYYNSFTNDVGTTESIAQAGIYPIRAGVAGNYTQLVLDDSPVLYWKLDENDNTIIDASGNQHNTTTTNTRNQTKLVNNNLDGATLIPAGNPVISTNTEPNIFANKNPGIDTQGATIEGWFNFPTLPSGGSSGSGAGFSFGGSALRMSYNSTSLSSFFMIWVAAGGGLITYTAPTAISTNTTYYVVLVLEAPPTGSTTGKLYVNGNYIGQASRGAAPLDSLPTSLSYSNFRTGTSTILDEIAIYNRALSPTEITNHYNQGIAAPNSPPSNTALPTISGTETTGATLTVTPGTWTGSPTPSLTYQWQRNTGSGWANISGATNTTYTLTNSDEGATIRVVETGTNSEGTASANSLATGAITRIAEITSITISGSETVGEVLTANVSTVGTPTPTLSYQWQRNTGSGWGNISGATSNTYTLTDSDTAATVRVSATATNSVGSDTETSAATNAITRIAEITGIAFSGTERVGETLTASVSTFGHPAPTVSYQWQRYSGLIWGDITGATNSTYVLGEADAGKLVRVTATATNSLGSDTAESAGSGAITRIAEITSLSVTGSPMLGETLTATFSYLGYPEPSFTYQWQRSENNVNWHNINGETNNTLTLPANDVGKYIRVIVTATNIEGADTETSPEVGRVGAPPIIDTPTISGDERVGETLTASATFSQGYPEPTITYQWQEFGESGWQNLAGATNATYTLQTSDAGKTLRVRATATNIYASDSKNSDATEAILWDPANTVAPVISYSGFLEVSNTLSVSNGTWTGYPNPTTFTYQWEESADGNTGWQEITGATNNTFTLTEDQTELYIRAKVSTTTTAGSASAYSATTGYVSEDPENIVAPTISGTASSGETLTADPGTWEGFPEPNFTYQWQKSLNGSTGWEDITGETATTITLNNLAAYYIRVWVTGTNPVGEASAASDAEGPVTEAPANTVLPEATGTAYIDSYVSVDNGTWTGYPEPSFTYQWQYSEDEETWQNISGATSATYLVSAGYLNDYLRAEVTATNSEGTEAVFSNSLGPVDYEPEAPQFITPPSISGTQAVGETLTADPGTASGYPEPTISIVWQVSVDNGATWQDTENTTTTYALTMTDAGTRLRVKAVAQNLPGTDEATSTPTQPIVAAPSSVTSPTIAGTPVAGQTLTADPGTWDGYPAPTFAYQWQYSADGNTWENITGANQDTFIITNDQVTQVIRVEVIATNSEGSTSEYSAATSEVLQVPSNVIAPTISGLTALGDELTADPGTWDGYPEPTFTYQWQRRVSSVWQNIAGEVGESYITTTNDLDRNIRVVVIATNSAGSASANSAPVGPITPQESAPVNTEAPVVIGQPKLGITLVGNAGTWTGYPTPTFTYQWQRASTTGSGANWVNISGATNTSLIITESYLDKFIRLKVVATNSRGTQTAYSAVIGPIVEALFTRSTVLPMSNARLQQIIAAPNVGVFEDSEFSSGEEDKIKWSGSADAFIKRKTIFNTSSGRSERYEEITVVIPYLAKVEKGSKIIIKENGITHTWEVVNTDDLAVDVGLPKAVRCYVAKV